MYLVLQRGTRFRQRPLFGSRKQLLSHKRLLGFCDCTRKVVLMPCDLLASALERFLQISLVPKKQCVAACQRAVCGILRSKLERVWSEPIIRDDDKAPRLSNNTGGNSSPMSLNSVSTDFFFTPFTSTLAKTPL